MKIFSLSLLFCFLAWTCPNASPDERVEIKPHIIWICAEDMNDWMGCYGDSTVPTPNIDHLAKNGVRFERAYMTAGVCSASRSAIALGAMQTSLGVHNHRSSRQRIAGDTIHLPKQIKTVYQLLRDNGYYVINAGPKNDFNFLWPSQSEYELKKKESPYGSSAIPATGPDELLYDHNSKKWAFQPGLWKDRPKGKPLFIQFQLKGGKNNGQFDGAGKKSEEESIFLKPNSRIYTDTSRIQVMPYYPDLPEVKKQIAHHYDCIRQTDDEIGEILNGLEKEGLLENALIFFWTDHGMLLPRHKQWLYEGGIRVPLIVAGPGLGKNEVRSDLISGIDISATTLSFAGITLPEWVEGKNIFDPGFSREFVVSARDRCDYTIDRVRAVTSQKYKYLKNFLTDRPFSQAQYRDHHPYMVEMKEYFEAGKMNPVQSYIWKEKRDPEELYDLENDPFEINNLANDPEYKDVLEEYRKMLTQWMTESGDQGIKNEPIELLRACYHQWSDKVVNPEFDQFTIQYGAEGENPINR